MQLAQVKDLVQGKGDNFVLISQVPIEARMQDVVRFLDNRIPRQDIHFLERYLLCHSPTLFVHHCVMLASDMKPVAYAKSSGGGIQGSERKISAQGCDQRLQVKTCG